MWLQEVGCDVIKNKSSLFQWLWSPNLSDSDIPREATTPKFAVRWYAICNFLNEVVLWDHVTNEICMSTFSGFMDTKLGKVLIYCIMATKLCSWQISTRKTLRSSLFVCVKIVLWLGVTIDKLYMYILVLMKFCLVIVSIEQLFSFWVCI